MSALVIPGSIYRELLAQAREQAPIEACGILGGRGDRVEVFHRMTNTDQSADHFLMEPAEQFKVVKSLRAAGRRMLAIHHSHPASPSRPSAEDIRLALTPDVLYTILSLQEPANPVLRAFAIFEGVVTEHPLTIDDL
ncbi:MAG: M67 family metallopeptidase [Polyangia bacterium]|jgi:proteasome lid subunit RPN8/RPN11